MQHIKMMLAKLPLHSVLDSNLMLNLSHNVHPKVSYHKLKAFLKELEKYKIIKQIGSSPPDEPDYGTTYLNPLITIPKEDSFNCLLDAGHLN